MTLGAQLWFVKQRACAWLRGVRDGERGKLQSWVSLDRGSGNRDYKCSHWIREGILCGPKKGHKGRGLLWGNLTCLAFTGLQAVEWAGDGGSLLTDEMREFVVPACGQTER